MRVLVVGAGVIGAAVAYELSRRGADVVVADMRAPGAGSTQAAAGVLAPWIEAHSGGLLTLGESSLRQYDAFIARVADDSGVPVEYQRRGTLEVALTGAQEDALRRDAARYAAAGVTHAWLDAHALRAAEPGVGPDARAAVLLPEQGYVQARALTEALLQAATARGAACQPATRVTRLTPSSAGVTADTSSGPLHADTVVLAAGSWSGEDTFAPVAATPVTPVRGQLLHLAAPAPLATRVLWGADCYLVPWQDGSLLVGGTVEHVGFDERSTAEGVEGLRRAAAALVPESGTAPLREVRVGLRPGTADHLPIIGRAAASPRVVFATGHYRNGVLLAPLTADLVAGLLLDGREGPELGLTAPARFGL
ncbi:MAG: glycine oxidase ThiO [Vicinamibacterales bacterium]